jgi:hypothetical protein
LVVIGLGMTVLVYGAVALLVKIDDVGLTLMENSARWLRRTGARIVRSMPAVFRVIGIIGTVAMLWVGGHLVIANLADTFWQAPYDVLHAATQTVETAGPVVVWVIDTALSAVFGLILGLIIVVIVLGISRLLKQNRPDGNVPGLV